MREDLFEKLRCPKCLSPAIPAGCDPRAAGALPGRPSLLSVRRVVPGHSWDPADAPSPAPGSPARRRAGVRRAAFGDASLLAAGSLPRGGEIQRRTAERFGAEWNAFRDMREDYQELFHSYFDARRRIQSEGCAGLRALFRKDRCGELSSAGWPLRSTTEGPTTRGSGCGTRTGRRTGPARPVG